MANGKKSFIAIVPLPFRQANQTRYLPDATVNTLPPRYAPIPPTMIHCKRETNFVSMVVDATRVFLTEHVFVPKGLADSNANFEWKRNKQPWMIMVMTRMEHLGMGTFQSTLVEALRCLTVCACVWLSVCQTDDVSGLISTFPIMLLSLLCSHFFMI